jgi:sterol desaturase/sphingolipid hydroxylase (fatty acid hydroxylase superfamily)
MTFLNQDLVNVFFLFSIGLLTIYEIRQGHILIGFGKFLPWVIMKLAYETYPIRLGFFVFPFDLRSEIAMLSIESRLGILFFAQELIYYLFHRSLHRFHFLWNFHRAHHNVRQMSWGVGFKIHIAETVAISILLAPVIYVVALPDHLLLLYLQFIAFLNLLQHVDFRFSLPAWVERIFITPRNHHWHHAKRNAGASDSNFGNITLFFDWLFNSTEKCEGYPQEIGIPKNSTDPFLKEFFEPFLFWRKL